MTATERLRQLLDERGVGWSTATKSTRYTAWLTEHGLAQAADYGEDGGIVSVIHRCTPEQAVEATLGRGTCKYVGEDGRWRTVGRAEGRGAQADGRLYRAVASNDGGGRMSDELKPCPLCGGHAVWVSTPGVRWPWSEVQLERREDKRMSELTATERLRQLLDERGVKWEDADPYQDATAWVGSSNIGYVAHEGISFDGPTGRLILFCLTPEQAVEATLGQKVTGQTSDGYHTFDELYHHRAVLFSVIVSDHAGLAWKSRKHHDGTMYEGMFIVGIDTPQGQATYHYDIDPYWDMFDCRELDRAPEWDGHTPDEAIERIATLRHRKTHTTEYCDRCEGAVLPTWKKCPWCGEPLEEVEQ